MISKNKGITKVFTRYSQLEMSTSGVDPIDSLLDEKYDAPDSSVEDKPNREYSIQLLNAIEELKREDWNGLLDENSRYCAHIFIGNIKFEGQQLTFELCHDMDEL